MLVADGYSTLQIASQFSYHDETPPRHERIALPILPANRGRPANSLELKS
jgi:hypothetical protein